MKKLNSFLRWLLKMVIITPCFTFPLNANDSIVYNYEKYSFYYDRPGTGTTVALSDNQLSDSLPIGFTFNFFGNNYTGFYISSNGFITFSENGGESGCCSGQSLPDTSRPNNLIAFAWADLDPGAGGTIEYFTSGTIPNRYLVVNFKDVPHHGNDSLVTCQVVLWEGYNEIAISTKNMASDGSMHTMGIENAEGAKAWIVSGRNSTDWSTADEYIYFYPYVANENDIGVIDLNLNNPFCEGNNSIIATVGNFGFNKVDSFTVNWMLNGVLQSPLSCKTSLNPVSEDSSTAQVIIGTKDFNAPETDVISIWTSEPNGALDGDNSNDTLNSTLQPLLGGTYTIGGSNPDFASFNDAVAYLSSSGVCKSVLFKVRSGTYNEQISIPEIYGVSDSATITFQSESADSNSVILTYSADYTNNFTVQLNGADYVTFDKITIKATNTSYSIVVAIQNGSGHNSFLNCVLTGVSISYDSNYSSIVYSDGYDDGYNSFKNNRISGGSYGFYYLGSSDTNLEKGTVIENNIFINQYAHAINLYYQDSLFINGNSITTNSSYTSFYGIYCYYCNNKIEVQKNKIIAPSGGYGIYLYSCNGDSASNGLIANNFVQVGGTSSAYGIHIYYSSYQKIFNNNINITSSSVSNGISLYCYSGSNIDIINNVLVNTGGGYALYNPTPSNISNSDYNDLYVTGINLAYWNGNLGTLKELQSASGQDIHSISQNPLFLSSTDLHVREVWLNNSGTPLKEVTTDIDNQLRDILKPDIGADEFDPPHADAGIYNIASPKKPFPAGSNDIIVVIKNFGTDTLKTLAVDWTLNGYQKPRTNWSGILTSGDTMSVKLGNYFFSQGIDSAYRIKAWTALPNGNVDVINYNDTLKSKLLTTAMEGTYTIGGDNPDYPYWQDAVDDLMLRGIVTNVHFKIRNGTYNEQIIIPEIKGTSANKTITFEPESSDSTLVILGFNSNSTNNFTIQLNGADYIKFNKLTFRATNASYGRVIDIRNGSTSNTFSNCLLQGIVTTSYSEYLSVVYSSGYKDDFNKFINNKISNGSYGFYYNGLSSSALEKGTLIENNVFENQYYIALFLQYQDSLIINNNIINTNSTNTNFYGIYCNYCNNKLVINRNKLFAPAGGFGIYLYSCNGTALAKGLISNNFVQVGGTSSAYGIHIYYSSYQKIFNNNINITSSSVSNGISLYCYSGSNIDIINNVLVNTGGGYALYNPTPSNISNSDYNDLYVTGINLAYWNGNMGTIKELQSASGQDIHSISQNPLFLSVTDLHVREVWLNGSGTPLAEVPADIDNQLRDTLKPDIGADEFSPILTDAGIFDVASPRKPFAIGNNSIIAVLKNHGSDTLKTVAIDWSVNDTLQQRMDWTGSLVSGDTAYVNLGTYLFSTDTFYSVKIWSGMPNNNPDIINDNDTSRILTLYTAMSGNYTIGGTDPDFLNFTAAIDALKLRGIINSVTFKIRNGTYNEQISIPEIVGTSPGKTITFESESSDSTLVILSFNSDYSNNYTVQLNGADYFSFTRLTIQATNGSYGRVLEIRNGSNYNTFANCIFQGISTTNTGDYLSLVYSNSSNDNFNRFVNNKFSNGSYGFYYFGNDYNNLEKGTSIENNTFENQYYAAFYLYYHDSILISGNTITTNSTYTSFYNINCYYCNNELVINKNKLIAPNGGYGIYLYSCTGTSSSQGLISNNFIQVGGTGTAYGIYLYYSGYQRIYNNSINITSTSASNGRAIYSYYNYTGNIDIKNNILVNTGGGYTLYTDYPAYISNSNYNDFYTTGINLAYWSGDKATLKDLQLASNKDSSSLSINPLFNSSADLHVREVWLNGSGTHLPEITSDIDNEIRDTIKPDIGADEFNPPSTDAGIFLFTEPKAPFPAGNNDIIVMIKNHGSDTLKTVAIDWSVNDTLQTRVNWTGALAGGDTVRVNLGLYSFKIDTQYSVKCWTTLPNGTSDVVNYNDTVQVTNLCPALGGIYTIGGTAPDFPNFQGAVNALIQGGGIVDSVVFKIRDGNYNEQISIPQIKGVSDSTSIKFEPESNDSSSVILSYAATSANNYTMQLNGADYIKFKKITIQALNSSYGNVIEIKNNSNHNNISNCVLQGIANSSYVIYSNTFNDEYNIFSNNKILNGGYGFYYGGVSSSNLEKGTVIENNIFENQYYSALYLFSQDSLVINSNNINTNSTYGSYYNIQCSYCNNQLQINKNKLFAPNGGYGIYLYYCQATYSMPGSIANNFIYMGGSGRAYGIGLYSSLYQNIYYNSVNITSTGTSENSCLYAYYGGGYYIKNNIFANKTGYAIYTNTNFSSSDYNDFYTKGNNLAYFLSNKVDLNAWRASTYYDSHSVSVDPFYVSDNDLHTRQILFKKAGIPISSITDDIDGDIRDANFPDIGADEFVMSTPCDAGIVKINPPKVPFSANNQTISVSLGNFGSDTLKNVIIEWTINDTLQTPFLWSGALASTKYISVNVGTYNFNPSVAYSIKAWTYNPDGKEDTINYNDTSAVNNLYAALNGTFTIGGDSPDFINFANAVNNIIAGGITGPVVFNVRPGVYNEQISIPPIIGSSKTNTITFQSENGDSTSVTLAFSANSTNNYTLQLNGSDYIIISKITLQATNGGNGRVIDFRNSSDHNTITNCILTGIQTTSTTTNCAIIYSGNSNDDYNIFSNNLFINGSFGFYYYSTSSSSLEYGTVIQNNTFENPYYKAISLNYQDSPSILSNTVNSNSNYGYTYGLDCYYCNNQLQIKKNKFHINNGATGISLGYCQGTKSSQGLISNNFIYVGGVTYARGISFYNTSYQRIYNNNINITNTTIGSSQSALYFEEYSNSNIDLRNNILANTGGGYALYVYYTSCISYSDYNNLYTSGNNLAYWSGNNATLKDLQLISNKDIHSVSVNPLFVSTSDLHVRAIELNESGSALKDVTDDIDNETRSLLKPDIGADEFVPPATDAGIYSFESQKAPLYSGNSEVVVAIKNHGSDTLLTVAIDWSVNGINQASANWTGNLASGDTALVNLGDYIFIPGVSYNIKSWTTLPNGVTDIANYNDTLEISNINTALEGIYTIGGASPNFQNFNDAVNALVQRGIVNSVLFKVRNGSYNEQISIPEILGSSTNNTITFESESLDSSAVTLSYAANDTRNYTVQLYGADYLTFRKLTIYTTNGYNVIDIRNTSNYNTISNCVLKGAGNNSSIVYSDESDDEYNQFVNNKFDGGGYGIYYMGTSLEIGTVIKNDTFANQYYYGIYISNEYSPIVNNNVIYTNSNNTYYNGIYCSSCYYQLQVNKNKIYIPNGGQGITLNSCTAINYLQGLISNNFISIGGTDEAYGIYLNGSSYQNVFNNSVNITCSSAYSYCFYTYYGSNHTIQNNIFANTTGYAVYDGYGNSINASDYNDLYTGGTNLAYRSGNFTDLASWRSTTYFDAHSISVDPLFSSIDDLHAKEVALNNKGIPVSSVTDDIDGELRNTKHPDIGADEFATPAPNDAGITAVNEPKRPFAATVQNIKVTLRNFGSDTLKSATIKWSVNNNQQTPFHWTGSLAPAATELITIGQYNFNISIKYSIKSWPLNPNGTADTINYNDTAIVNNLYAALNGTYTIGGNSPDFIDFTNAVDNIVNGGIIGPVIFNVRPGKYNDQITIPSIVGSSESNTITFVSEDRDSSLVVLSYAANSLQNYTMQLDGADNLRFEKMTFEALNPEYYSVISIQNSSNNIHFKNSIIKAPETFNHSRNFGIISSPSSSNNNNNEFKNNAILYGFYGIYKAGAGSESGTVVENNLFKDQYYMAINLSNQSAPRIKGNEINTILTNSNFYGIYLYSCSNSISVTENKISCPNGGYGLTLNNSSGTSSNYGLVANNFIQTGGTSTGYGISISSASYLNVYFNTVNVTSTNINNGRAFYFNGYYSSYINLANNIFTNNGGGYSIYFDNPTSYFASDYNDLFTTGSTLGYWNGNQSGLSNWSNASSLDIHSFNVDPLFYAPDDLHVLQPALNNAGIAVSAVTKDIDNELRSATNPDIGADEFFFRNKDVGIKALLSPINQCYKDSSVVTVKIQNYSSNSQTGFNVAYSINNSVPVVENIGTLVVGPGKVVDYTFSKQIDNYELQTYSLTLFTLLSGDEEPLNDTLEKSITNYPLPGIVGNMIPHNESDGISNPVSFSWSPASDALRYDLFIWQAGSSKPVIPAVSNITQISYTYNNTISYGISNNWQVVSKTNFCSTDGPIQTFTIRELPDLIVNSVQTPLTVYSGQSINVDYEVKNIGLGSTVSQQWIDAVYLSTDSTLETNIDLYVGGLGNTTQLETGQSYMQTLSFTVPNGINGNYYIIVRSNMNNVLLEASNQNNISKSSLSVYLTPPPDLKVTSIITPGTVFSGQAINVTWTASNKGSGVTDGEVWKDRIYLTKDTIFTGSGTILGEFEHAGKLNPEESYNQTQQVTIPANVFGKYYIYVKTDIYSQVYEHANENNNTRQSDSMNIILTPPPDLIISGILIPDSVSSNEQIIVQWTVENDGGSATLQNGWTDRIYLSLKDNFDQNSIVAASDAYHSGVLNMGDSYAGQSTFTIPTGITGPYYIYVATDVKNEVFEYTNENNNISRSNSDLIISAPDLIVNTVTAPIEGNSGENITVSWQTSNIGTGSVFAQWNDQVFISGSPVYDPKEMTKMQKVGHSDIIHSGESVAYNESVTLPDGYSGDYYLYMVTDADNNVYELSDTNNVNKTGTYLKINLSSWPDLQAKLSSIPDTLTAGNYQEIAFQVMNKGIAGTKELIWTDKIYLSPDSIWTPHSARMLSEFSTDHLLPADSAYIVSGSIQIPNDIPEGIYYIYAYADANNLIYEHTDENNNYSRSAPVFVYKYPPVDLVVTDIIVPVSSGSGKAAEIQWTVKNIGNATTFADYWTDVLYLSNDTILDNSDLLIKEWNHSEAVNPGKSYTASETFDLPNGIQGNYYFIMLTDKEDKNNDDNRSNNTRLLIDSSGKANPITISLTPAADLTVNSFICPLYGIAGQPIKASWSVRNIGKGPTASDAWTERIYLSTDMVIDNNDIILGTFNHTGILQPTQSYNDTMDVVIPVNVSGNYIVIIKADNNNSEYEYKGENNNTAFSNIVVSIPPPSDLIVSNISMPGNALTGANITISWSVFNIGANPATGIMKDMVYVSSDSVWDINDYYFGAVNDNINIAPLGYAERSVTAELPGTPEGQYYFIVRTDILDNINEADNSNNTAYSKGTLNISVNELRLNIKKSDVLVNSKPLYYKINIPEELTGEALYVELKGDSVNGKNEFYIRYNKMPTRVVYDYSHDNPYVGNQEIIISSLEQGTYYLMLYGNSTASNTQSINLFANKLDFKLRSITANKGGNTGKVTVLLQGAKFDQSLQAFLTSGSDSIKADTIYYVNNVKVYATFNLSGKKIGKYNLFIKKSNNETDKLTDGFEVILGTKPDFQLYARYPAATSPRSTISMTIEYSNAGNVDIAVPLLKFKSMGGAPVAFTVEELKKNEIMLKLKCIEINGPGNILRPGAIGSIVIYVKATTGLGFTIDVPDFVNK